MYEVDKEVKVKCIKMLQQMSFNMKVMQKYKQFQCQPLTINNSFTYWKEEN